MAKRAGLSLRGQGINNKQEEASPKAEKAPAKQANPQRQITLPSNEKVIKDTFSFPSGDYALIQELREACAKTGVIANKSEVVRAGLLALASMSDADLSKALRRIEKVKVGRPKDN
ncbi:hypothetical protein [Zhongshania marina]|uniref:Uncharacterized protein n=1 Tax=Zhongshania marina TaxID=2304603 RepID=A0A2S4HC47_9GAMM|nr:hypothetical protein [Marortus luteolus]POP51540.1 hypothetical protein C0068_16520 [Marortus luteolus]